MVIETILSMLTRVCHLKKVAHRRWEYFKTRLAFTMAVFNLLIQWDGLPVDADGFVPLSIAQFSFQTNTKGYRQFCKIDKHCRGWVSLCLFIKRGC